MRSFSAGWRRLGGPSSAPKGEPYSSQEWDSAGGAAEAAAEKLLGRHLSGEEKRCAAAAVHYVVGGLAATGYAAAVRALPRVQAGSGAVFGIAFWLLGDELLMSRIGLTARPSAYSPLMHLNSLGEHLVYGITVERVRRTVLSFG